MTPVKTAFAHECMVNFCGFSLVIRTALFGNWCHILTPPRLPISSFKTHVFSPKRTTTTVVRMTLADAAWLLIQKNPAEKSTYPNYIENCMKKGIHDHPLKINMEPEITLLETENLHLASKCSFQGFISDIFSIFFSKSTGGRFRFLPFELIDGI